MTCFILLHAAKKISNALNVLLLLAISTHKDLILTLRQTRSTTSTGHVLYNHLMNAINSSFSQRSLTVQHWFECLLSALICVNWFSIKNFDTSLEKRNELKELSVNYHY